jgi:hypothetical protein
MLSVENAKDILKSLTQNLSLIRDLKKKNIIVDKSWSGIPEFNYHLTFIIQHLDSLIESLKEGPNENTNS